MKKYTHVTIDRKKWMRGTGDGLLRNHGGKMCCLGFACLVLGLKTKDILDKSMPRDTGRKIPGLTTSADSSLFAVRAARVNDQSDINDKEREKQLRTLARKNGFIFKFVN